MAINGGRGSLIGKGWGRFHVKKGSQSTVDRNVWGNFYDQRNGEGGSKIYSDGAGIPENFF